MTNQEQDSNPHRSATRAPIGRPIKLQFDDSMDLLEGRCENLSIGGMFIIGESSRPAGSLVRFELLLEDNTAVRGLGEIVWMRPGNEGAGRQSGMGLKFRFLEQRDRQMIFKLVSQHIKARLANQHAAGAELPVAAAPPPAESPPPPASVDEPPAAGSGTGWEPQTGSSDYRETIEDLSGEASAASDASDLYLHEDPAALEPGGAEPPEQATEEEPEPAAERRVPLLAVAAVLILVLAAAGLFVFRDAIFGGAGDPGVPTTLDQPGATAAPTGEAPGPGASESAAAAPEEAARAPSPSGLLAVPPPTTTPPPPQPTPPPPAPGRTAESGGAAAEPQPSDTYTRIIDISWREVPEGLLVIFAADGPVPRARYKHFRLGGAQPREVIQFHGVRQRFFKQQLPVGGPGVSKIRTGFHDGNELRVVLDLLDEGARITEIRSVGTKVEALISLR